MSNFRIDKLLIIDNEVNINRNDTIKITINTGEVIIGDYMQVKLHLYTEIELFRKGMVWGFDIVDIEKIEIVKKAHNALSNKLEMCNSCCKYKLILNDYEMCKECSGNIVKPKSLEKRK